MCIHGMQKRVALQAAGGSRRVEIRLRTVAIDHIVPGISRIGGVGDAELSVIEDIERLNTELEIQTFR